MLKVLFVTRKWPPAIGGMETYSLELSRELERLCDLKVRALPGRADHKPPSPLSLILFFFSSMIFVATRRKYQLIHIGDLVLWPVAIVARIFQPSANLVVTAYGLDILYGSRKGVLPFFYRQYLALGVRLVGASLGVIAISHSTAKLCGDIGFSNVTVVPLGVRLPPRVQGTPPGRGGYVLFVGRLVRRKGVAWFTHNVLPLLPAELRLKVVGKCWDEDEWAAIRGNRRVDYCGVVTDKTLRELRNSALVTIMPNIRVRGTDIEGFGLTALEAAADGGVLLASDIEGIVDAVIDGQTGFLLPAEAEETWASKIIEIMKWSNQQREQFVLRSRKEIEDRFSWSHVATNTMSLYQSLVAAK